MNRYPDLAKVAKWMTLASTVPYMVSGDHKNRLKAEILQLAIRKHKLEYFLNHWDSLDFTPKHPKELFEKQLKAMNDYLDILMERSGNEFKL